MRTAQNSDESMVVSDGPLSDRLPFEFVSDVKGAPLVDVSSSCFQFELKFKKIYNLIAVWITI